MGYAQSNSKNRSRINRRAEILMAESIARKQGQCTEFADAYDI